MDASPSTTNTAGGNSSVSSEEPTASQTDASPLVGGSREESSRHCSAAGNASGKHCAEKEAYNAHGDPPKSQVNDAPISPTNDEVAIGVSELSGPVYEEINTNDAQPPESPEHCIPPSTPDDVAIELGGVDNLAYEPETSPTLPKEFTAIREVGEERDVPGCDEHDYDAPTSLTTPSSVSEDLAIDLSGLESPTHEAKSGDADSDKTVTPIPSEDYMSITIQEDVPTPKSPKSSNVSMTTVVTAVVESAQEKPVREGEELSAVSENDNTAPTYPPTATSESEHRVETMLLETVDLNTTLLASGDALPSLPPPHVLPDDDETSARILISDDMDKAALAELEMKILQKTESGSPPGAERCDSQLSTLSDKIDICRICHCEGEENNKLISPCLCSGSLKYLHLSCLQKWIKSSDKKSCELCNFDYIMSTKTRPFKEWEKLEMTHVERRKVVCSVTFHIIAITCVIWSLYVLIDRTTEEVHLGTLDWPFWTKLIVVAIGFTGGMIFMYVQCKMYVHLCVRWRAFNKLIFVENAPEDPQLRAEAAARIKDKAQEEGGMVNPIALQELDAV